MKEATGELNMTVITIVAIGALVAFFYLVIWPTIQNGMILNSACNNSNGGLNTYSQTINNGGTVTCGSGRCTYVNGTSRTTQTCEN